MKQKKLFKSVITLIYFFVSSIALGKSIDSTYFINNTLYFEINDLNLKKCNSLNYSDLLDSSYVLVANIIIKGNNKTKPFVIERELDLKPKSTVVLKDLSERLLQNQKRIFNTTLFLEVKVDTEKVDTETINIIITVKENWYVWAAPYFRLNDRNFNEWVDRGSDFRRLNYGAFLDHENFLGRMQKVEFVFETGFTNRFNLRYNIPYLDKSGKNGIYTDFRYQTLSNLNYTTNNNQLDFIYKDQSLKQQFNGKVKYRFRGNYYVFHYMELAFDAISISDTIRNINNNYLANQSRKQQFASLAYTFRYDKRDNINFPLKGRALIANIGKLGLFKGDDFNSWQFRLAFADYYPLNKKIFFNYIFKASVFTNTDIPYNLLRGIGYEEHILRGYDLYVVNGSAYTSGRVNLKREFLRKDYKLNFIKWKQFNLIPINIYINAFADIGYVYNKYSERINNSLANKRLTSYGLGLELNTAYNAVIKLNLSRNSLNETNFFVNFQKDIWTRWY